MDNVSFVRFLIVSAVSSYYLSKFWRTTMQKKANGQTPAENPLSLLQGRYFQCMRFELDFYSLSTKTELEFYFKFLE